MRYAPDIVLAQFCINDLNNPSSHFDAQTRSQLGPLPDAAFPDPAERGPRTSVPTCWTQPCNCSRVCVAARSRLQRWLHPSSADSLDLAALKPRELPPAPRGVGWVTSMPGWHKQRRPAMRALRSWCSLIGTRLRARRPPACSANFKPWGRSADSKSSTFCPHSKPPGTRILCFSMPGIQRRRATPSLLEPLRSNFNCGPRRRHRRPSPRARKSHGWSPLAFPAEFRSLCPGVDASACAPAPRPIDAVDRSDSRNRRRTLDGARDRLSRLP